MVSLVAFLIGAALGGRMAGALPARTLHLSRAMLIEICVLLLAAVLALVLDVTPDRFSGDLIIALLAFGMGVRNATVRRVKVADLTTTVLTMTLTWRPTRPWLEATVKEAGDELPPCSRCSWGQSRERYC